MKNTIMKYIKLFENFDKSDSSIELKEGIAKNSLESEIKYLYSNKSIVSLVGAGNIEDYDNYEDKEDPEYMQDMVIASELGIHPNDIMLVSHDSLNDKNYEKNSDVLYSLGEKISKTKKIKTISIEDPRFSEDGGIEEDMGVYEIPQGKIFYGQVAGG